MKFFQDVTQVTFAGIDHVFNVSSIFCEFTLGGHLFTIKWYGLIIAIGFILAALFGGRIAYTWKMDLNKMIDVLIYGTLGGIIGARLYYCLFQWNYYGSHPLDMIKIWEGGLAIYGGIIGGLIAAFIVCKVKKLNFLNLLDIAGMSLLIGQGIGRWGNFANQEAFGGNTNANFGMMSEKVSKYILNNHVALPDVDPNLPVHPTFFYGSVWCLLGVLLIYLIYKKCRKFSGQLILCYGVWYGFGRMIIEGFRTDSLYIGNTDIRVSQLLSLIAVVVCLMLLIIFTVKYTKHPKPIEGIDYFIEPVPFFRSRAKKAASKERAQEKDAQEKDTEENSSEEKSSEEKSTETEDEGNNNDVHED